MPAILMVALLVGVGEAITDEVEESVNAPPGRRAEAAEPRARRPGGLVGVALVGMPVGGFLYGLLSALPFLAGVLPYAVAGLLVLLMGTPGGPLPSRQSRNRGESRGVGLALVPGTLALTGVAAAAAAANSAVLGVLVLFAVAELGLGGPAFGVLLAGLAGAATLGSLVAPEIGRALGPRRALSASLVVTGAGYVGAALLAEPGYPIVAIVFLALASGAAMVGGVVLRALLHAAAERSIDAAGLRAFHAVVWAAIPAGALAGGLAARAAGVGGLVLGAGGASVAVAAVATRVAAGGGPSAERRRRAESVARRPASRRDRPTPPAPAGARHPVARTGRPEFSRNSVDVRP